MMEFEEEHEGEEEEEEEEDDDEMPITPTYKSAAAAADKKPGGGGGVGGGVGVAAARYRECLKNHAVGIGGHAVDGCGEFMPGGAEGTLDALKCAACNCHRNFHRKELLHLEPTPTNQLTLFSPRPHNHHPYPHHHQHQTPPVYNFYPPHYNRTPTTQGPAGFLHVSGGQGQPRPLALPSPSGGGGGGGSRETVGEQEVEHVMMGIGTMSTTTSCSGKKRHRTKFSQEQKDKMLELAEKVGWRIQKQDETVVQQFCDETGVKRHVLKVWMHNNKHTLGKKP